MYGNIEVVELRPPFTLYREDLFPIQEEVHIFTASKEKILRDTKLYCIDGRWAGEIDIVDFVFEQYAQNKLINFKDPYLSTAEKIELIVNKNNDKYWIREENQ